MLNLHYNVPQLSGQPLTQSPTNPRKLRIAWSVVWGVVAVLLCVLWVRSYSCCDVVYCIDKNLRLTTIGSEGGTAYLFRMDYGPNGSPTKGWEYSKLVPHRHSTVFEWSLSAKELVLRLPFWILALAFSSVAAAPWIQWSNRFSLRTLLIATTVVAVGLGIIVWMNRAG